MPVRLDTVRITKNNKGCHMEVQVLSLMLTVHSSNLYNYFTTEIDYTF